MTLMTFTDVSCISLKRIKAFISAKVVRVWLPIPQSELGQDCNGDPWRALIVELTTDYHINEPKCVCTFSTNNSHKMLLSGREYHIAWVIVWPMMSIMTKLIVIAKCYSHSKDYSHKRLLSSREYHIAWNYCLTYDINNDQVDCNC